MHSRRLPWRVELEQPKSIRRVVYVLVEVRSRELDHRGVRLADLRSARREAQRREQEQQAENHAWELSVLRGYWHQW